MTLVLCSYLSKNTAYRHLFFGYTLLIQYPLPEY
nr:MAG TPA: hypothetical protein [Caudoviricetes sp.]